MKVLMIRPNEHPVVMKLASGLKAMYDALECDTITAVYPWSEPIALVTDDNGLYSDKEPCRFVKELQQPIMGNFFLCGLGAEDFADLPEEYIKKYRKLFWKPELMLSTPSGMVVIQMEDGTQPED